MSERVAAGGNCDVEELTTLGNTGCQQSTLTLARRWCCIFYILLFYRWKMESFNFEIAKIILCLCALFLLPTKFVSFASFRRIFYIWNTKCEQWILDCHKISMRWIKLSLAHTHASGGIVGGKNLEGSFYTTFRPCDFASRSELNLNYCKLIATCSTVKLNLNKSRQTDRRFPTLDGTVGSLSQSSVAG